MLAQSVGAIPVGQPPAAPTATSTNTIAYQGRLADAAGAPLTGRYNIIFRLYSAASGGAPLWEEQWTGQMGASMHRNWHPHACWRSSFGRWRDDERIWITKPRRDAKPRRRSPRVGLRASAIQTLRTRRARGMRGCGWRRWRVWITKPRSEREAPSAEARRRPSRMEASGSSRSAIFMGLRISMIQTPQPPGACQSFGRMLKCRTERRAADDGKYLCSDFYSRGRRVAGRTAEAVGVARRGTGPANDACAADQLMMWANSARRPAKPSQSHSCFTVATADARSDPETHLAGPQPR